MTENKKPDLKDKDVEKRVLLSKSKKIQKNADRLSQTKKKFRQTILKVSDEAIKGKPGILNGNSNDIGTSIHKKNKKHKQKQGKAKKQMVTTHNSEKALPKIGKNQGKAKVAGDTKDISDNVLAKIEKKKAKKLAKKLKKEKIKEAKKLEYPKKEDEIDCVSEHIVDPLQSKQKQKIQTKKSGCPVINETKESDAFNNAATVFVGNLPVNTKQVQLKRLFANFGPVNRIRFRTASGKMLFKHQHRKEAGTLNAWVVLKDAETATRSLELNGTVFKNNHLRITSADFNTSSSDSKRTIFVGNLKYSVNEEKLREIFSSCGDIDYVRCLYDDKGCKGVAYVCFKAPEAVGLALELNETMLDERPIHLERYSVKKLGAKKVREATGGETKKTLLGKKKLKNEKQKYTKEDQSYTKDSDTKKKTKFRGVKVDAFKKKQKKKVTSQMQKLSEKIAPK